MVVVVAAYKPEHVGQRVDCAGHVGQRVDCAGAGQRQRTRSSPCRGRRGPLGLMHRIQIVNVTFFTSRKIVRIYAV